MTPPAVQTQKVVALPSQMLIPLSLVGVLVVAVVTGYIWLDDQFDMVSEAFSKQIDETEASLTETIDEQGDSLNQIKEAGNDLEVDLERLKAEGQAAYQDRYTRTMAERDALRRALANPDLWEPDPANPGSYLRGGNDHIEGNQP